MCTVSAITDYGNQFIPNRYPWVQPTIGNPLTIPDYVTRVEFETLRQEVLALKLLLEEAKKFDKKTDQHDCEKDEKVAILKKIANLVGVNLDDVFKS